MWFLIPVTLFVTIGAIVIAVIIQNGKYKLKLQETVRHSIDADAPLSADAIRELVAPHRDDMRTGLILVAIWGACIVFGAFVGAEDMARNGFEWDEFGPIIGIGAFPGLIGAVLIALHISRKGGS